MLVLLLFDQPVLSVAAQQALEAIHLRAPVISGGDELHHHKPNAKLFEFGPLLIRPCHCRKRSPAGSLASLYMVTLCYRRAREGLDEVQKPMVQV